MLDENGGVYAFGNGRLGCIGIGDNESQMFPVRITEFSKCRTIRMYASSFGM